MEFKHILVALDHLPSCRARLELAVRLARQHSARLAGLYTVAHSYYESEHNEAADHAARMQAEFVDCTGRAGVDAQWIGVDWQVVGVNVAEIVTMHAYYTDLVVVGQDEPGADLAGGLAERVILGSGRPVLVVPYAGNLAKFGEHVMVSWNAGRESTRAANDALPFLTKAAEVRVVEVNASQPGTPRAELLCDHLALHGVAARAEHVVAADVSVGDALLNRIPVEGADLLVMGAYGRTRLGSLALGDVARHILRHMTVPVLMSH